MENGDEVAKLGIGRYVYGMRDPLPAGSGKGRVQKWIVAIMGWIFYSRYQE